jgi:phosphatidylinositol-3,4,5-trisphosphate 3-phosphatase and dual-specificity protein phosphatase PTEN
VAMKTLQKKIQTTVSQDRHRFKDGKYDLDLTYVTQRVIAMAMPTKGFSTAWRNGVEEVSAMLHDYHGHNFMIWNLCEYSYDYAKFDHQVFEFTFPGMFGERTPCFWSF